MPTIAQGLVDGALKTPGLDTAADGLQSAVRAAYASPLHPLKDLLHGSTLGHALHPAITDVPVGAWTAALVLDALGERRGAKIAVGVGLAGAVAAAATGLTDWAETSGRPRRLGVMHAALNAGATVLYGASFALRPRAQRTAMLLSGTGYALVALAAFYGGELALDMQIGTNRAHALPLPRGEADAGAADAVPEGGMLRVEAGGYPVLLTKRGGAIRAIGALCAHQGGPLDEGTLEGDVVTCPWHGSRFCVRDGGIEAGPTAYPQPAFRTRVVEGRVRIRADEPQR